jgi:GrpB-like predicted nucleotidyltransferase (UPF0157 family)
MPMKSENADLPSVEELEVTVVPYDPDWVGRYEEEAARVRPIFGLRCAAVEHIGSTAVCGLLAKPIIDILIASIDESAPSPVELDALAAQGYVFLGEDGRRPGRWFWRKRGPLSFNLSVVPWASELWRDNLLLRDYLRAHPIEVQEYGAIKHRAVAGSPNSLLGYQDYKRAFVTALKVRAREWSERICGERTFTARCARTAESRRRRGRRTT